MSARDGGKLEQRPQTNYLIFQSERKKCERLKVKQNYVLLFFLLLKIVFSLRSPFFITLNRNFFPKTKLNY